MRQYSANLLEPQIPAQAAHRGPEPAGAVPVNSVRPPSTSTESWRVLVVESDTCDADALIRGLRRHGHDVAGSDTGAKALRSYQDVDLVLLDLELPDLDGLEVCKEIRSACDVPIIAVTARSTELDCVLALQAGADDYLVKPYGFRELMARMDAVMRRSRSQSPAPQAIAHGRLLIDAGTREVHLDSRRIEVTRKEFDLLYHLATHPDTVVSRKELMQRVWGDTWSRRTVDTHVSSLRSKLGASGWIITVRGVGFRFGHA
ncbi:response regulator transcription factor [Streptomyces xanthochromogenes]|uniref:response regulator transcription factor n=1 Tax=Streptomyces xanthochromogenes TaxID=67384 RepID=UPI00342E20AA